jgi:hypothetical protein
MKLLTDVIISYKIKQTNNIYDFYVFWVYMNRKWEKNSNKTKKINLTIKILAKLFIKLKTLVKEVFKIVLKWNWKYFNKNFELKFMKWLHSQNY